MDNKEEEQVRFKYIVTPKLVRSEKLIVGIIQKKKIVKETYLDSCKKAGKWIPSEPFCWMNDAEIIQYIPSDGTERTGINEKLKAKVDLIQAMRAWQSINVEKNPFYGKNVFIWVPSPSIKTYYKILASLGASVFSIKSYEDLDASMEECVAECTAIENKIDEVYLCNEAEIKNVSKRESKSRGESESEKKKLFKHLMKKLTAICQFWCKEKKLKCYDLDFIVDWTLEAAVFKDSDITMEQYGYSIE